MLLKLVDAGHGFMRLALIFISLFLVLWKEEST
jgi:hypothetical protein